MHRRRLIFLALLYLPAFLLWGQTTSKQQAAEYLRLAEEMMSASQADNDIREVLLLAANADPDNIKANFEAGHFYLRTVGKDLAIKYFLRVYERNPTYRFDLEYWIGKSYQYGLQFDKAIDFYTRYEQHVAGNATYQGDDKVDRATVVRSITECENGRDFVSHPGNYSIINIGREVNSEWDDYAPVLNENEDELIFTSRRKNGNLNEDVSEDNKPYEDIFVSTKVGGAWSPAKNIGRSVNTQFHDSNVGLSADGMTLFLYKDSNGGDIYYCTRQAGDRWSEPKPLVGLINTSYAEESISISRDQNTLYFSSNRPGGFGGLDIYAATKDAKGEWSNVKNLGPSINTDQDEAGPFVDYDGVTLYFSSKGWKNMGGFDIFKSVLSTSNNSWSTPQNLGYPINTPDNDIFYVTTRDGQRAYYSSVRADAMGYDDIYMITVKQPQTATKPVSNETVATETKPEAAGVTYVVRTVDGQTRTPLDASVSLQGLRDNMIMNGIRKEAGVYEFTVDLSGDRNFRLSAEKAGYGFQNLNVTLGSTSASRTLEMKKLTVGTIGVLKYIYFDFDKATFQTESYLELNKLDRMMQENQNLHVEISGHTDNVGNDDYNLRLSQKRAEAVKDFLTSKGIDTRRIVAVGYGEKKPLVSNDDEAAGREINRRVEYKVLENP